MEYDNGWHCCVKDIFLILKDYKSFLFLSSISKYFMIISLISGAMVNFELLQTKYITHVPLAIFASGAMILAIVIFITGVILDAVNRQFDELYYFIGNKQ